MPAMIRSMRYFLFVILFSVLAVGCQTANNDSSSSEEMARAHEGDTPAATEAARTPNVPVDDTTIAYARTKAGPDITGFLAAPANPDSVLRSQGHDPSMGALPGIVVIHEWWGLNDNVRGATRRLAAEGYRALAVDLYGDSTASTPGEAKAMMQSATDTPEQLMANVRSAHEYLQSEWDADRVAVMGWCFGGGITFRAVADRPTAFDAAVVYYGTPESMTGGVIEELTTPILAHFGSKDEVVSTAQVDSFRSRVQAVGADVQIHTYEAGHAFANPSGENYEPAAASEAWSRTTSFLNARLFSSTEQ